MRRKNFIFFTATGLLLVIGLLFLNGSTATSKQAPAIPTCQRSGKCAQKTTAPSDLILDHISRQFISIQPVCN